MVVPILSRLAKDGQVVIRIDREGNIKELYGLKCAKLENIIGKSIFDRIAHPCQKKTIKRLIATAMETRNSFTMPVMIHEKGEIVERFLRIQWYGDGALVLVGKVG